jgi:hypothetical protein
MERPCRSLGERGLILSPSGREDMDAPKAEVVDAEVKTLRRPPQDGSETSSRRAATREMLPSKKSGPDRIPGRLGGYGVNLGLDP